jgi:signal transduction histidine kinase/CheY-like chemotaxis protein
MPAAPPGVVETGVPSFVVLGAESLGFSTAPSDLHLLPDGRILVVSQREIAIGDGVRWETFQQADGQSGFIYAQVAVGDDGRIYAGINRAIARIDLGDDARWRFVPVLSVPTNDPYSHVVQFPDTWLWYSGGGAVIAWRPGQPIRTFGLSAAVEHIFAVGNERFASNGSSGSLHQLHLGGAATLVSPINALVTDAVTCSVDDGADQIIVGTAGDGLRAFDGRSLNDVAVPRILGPGRRINDICRVGANLYAAAVDTTGIVFFERGGRIVQVLNRTLDHRLARAHRLVYSRNGVLWALLDNAVACVQFPSPISDFEPLLAGVINYARPLRHQGELWILADGRLMRGGYTADGCLEHLELDTPPGRFLWAIAETGGRLFATNDEGIFIRDRIGWQQIAAGIVNARVGVGPAPIGGRFFYVARGEIGWIQESGGRYTVQRTPVKGLGEVYNAVDDSTGAAWLELGMSRVGRVEFGGGEPTVRFFGKEDGLGDGWASLFALDGIVRCSTSLHLQRFDARTGRFVGDEELTRRLPILADSRGRPARDASGRLWFACQGTVRFVDDQKAGENPAGGSLALGFEPTEFQMETGGIIWMQGRGHLIRFDPGVPRPQSIPLRAQITSVQLAASNRHLLTPGPALPPLPYSDNSLAVRFAAVSSPFGPPVSFETMIEGAANRWVSTGTVGSVSFNRLKEGRYVFRVRPVMAGTPGEEARLAFTVQPPWHRTKLAWAIYIITGGSLVLLGAWFFSYLERHEMIRLGRLVAERTTALAASEERYRRLNAELEGRVSDRTTELSKTNADLKREITERQQAEERIRRLNRTLAVLSDIDQAIVRERDLPALYRETCRIAVEKGGFRIAWIGMLESAAGRVNPVAHAGEAGDYIEKIGIDLGEGVRGAGPTATAMRRGEHAICNDMEHDPYMPPWRDAALRLGYRSSGAFPLKVGGRTIGAINLYSGEPGFFDDEELTLLDELAMDLSFAIEHGDAESGRRQAEERVRHLAAFPELNPNPVFEFAADGVLAYANAAAHALAAVTGVADLSSLLPPGTQQIVTECLAQGQPRLRLETQNGPRTISWSFYPIASQQTVHCYAGDITERLQLEERFRQAQKMEAIGQLAGGVAHDFNNLLTVIQGHCGLLLADADPAKTEITESAKEIQAAASRAAKLTRQLLTFSRRQPMQVRPLDLDDVVSSVGRMLHRLIGEDIVLHTSLLPGGAWVEGDSGMIEQVLLNLAVNARDAMPDGGELWLGLDNVTLDETATLRHPAARPGSFICMSLRDTGRGIATDHLSHIFEPFFTTKEVGKGTGLGLATVHGIVEQHHGWVEVESPPGKGTTFRVHLPRLLQGASRPGGPRDESRVSGGNESILVVEDEAAVRVLAVKILGAQGYRVQSAPSGAAALELWRQKPGVFDLLLTDLIMPGGVSGAQLGEILRTGQPGLRIIYMSGYRGGTTGGEVGANFLQKPFDPAQLAAAVRNCLDSG